MTTTTMMMMVVMGDLHGRSRGQPSRLYLAADLGDLRRSVALPPGFSFLTWQVRRLDW